MGKLRPRGSPAGLLGWEAVAPRQPLLVPPGSPLGGVWRMRRRPPVSSTGATRSGSFRLKTKTKEARPRSSRSRRSCEPPPASSPIPHCWAEGASRHQAPPRTGGPRASHTGQQLLLPFLCIPDSAPVENGYPENSQPWPGIKSRGLRAWGSGSSLSRLWPWPLLASPTPSASLTLCTIYFSSFTPPSRCCRQTPPPHLPFPPLLQLPPGLLL